MAEADVTVRITLERNNVQAGDEVVGMVELLVRTAIPAPGLILYFKGTEKTQWMESRKVANSVSRTYKGKAAVVSHRFPLFRFTEQLLQPCQLAFPFAVRTPANAPSSFDFRPHCNEGDPTVASIGYKLVARLEGSLSPTPTAKSVLVLTQAACPPCCLPGSSQTVTLSSWCCLQQGRISLRSDLNQLFYHPGDTAVVKVEVIREENQPKETAIIAYLTRTIRMRDLAGHVKVARETVSDVRETESVDDTAKSTLNHSLRLQIPGDSAVGRCASVASQLIECEYRLTGEVEMDGCFMCCGDIPQIAKAIWVLPPKARLQHTVEFPLWNPQVMPQTQFVAKRE